MANNFSISFYFSGAMQVIEKKTVTVLITGCRGTQHNSLI